MHTFEILPAKSPLPAATGYGNLVAPFQAYVDREISLVDLYKETALVGIAAQYLPLDDLSLHPLKALRLLGCSNVALLASITQYECGFTKTARNCFLPLGVVTSLKGLVKYHEAFDLYGKTYKGYLLHLLTDARRFQPEVFQVPSMDDESVTEAQYSYERGLSRLERLFLGSGASVHDLTTGADLPQLGAVALRLSNEDFLVGVAYR